MHLSVLTIHARKIILCIIATFSVTCLALEISTKVYSYIEKRFGQPAAERIKQWQRLSNLDTEGLSETSKLKLVNDFFNKVPFVSDIKHWQKDDYWASPIEMLATNGGDCEDYSVAKYFTLRALGVAEEKMKITYVKALELNQAHMVLAFYATPDAEPLILDNLTKSIEKASLRKDLAPVYSFNGEGLWLSKFGGQLGKRLGDAHRLDNWKQLLERHSKLVK